MSNEEYVHQILKNVTEGNDYSHKLVFDKASRRLRPASSTDDPDQMLSAEQQDMNLS